MEGAEGGGLPGRTDLQCETCEMNGKKGICKERVFQTEVVMCMGCG